MSFVKLDTRILRSSLWLDREAREMFITALLLAEPKDFKEPVEQIECSTLESTGFSVPAGWYGFAPASGPGIAHTACIDQEAGMRALERLCSPDPESMSSEHQGRRLIRCNGGYLVLNYMRYREKDETAAARMRRYREKRSDTEASHAELRVTLRNVTHAEAEAEAEAEADIDPPDPAKPKSDLPEKKKRVVSAFNAFAEKKGWFALTGRPPKMTNDLLTKFCEDETRFSKLDEYMRRVSESTMEACRIDVWLRANSFNKIMSGEWGPKEDAYAKPQEELDLSKPWNVRKEPA